MDGYTYGLLDGMGKYQVRAESNIARANQTIDELGAERNAALIKVHQLEQQLAKAQRDIKIERARTDGMQACVNKLKEQVKALDPDNRYLKYTGRMYRESKMPETGLSPVFEKTFDAKVTACGLNPLDYRYEAK